MAIGGVEYCLAIITLDNTRYTVFEIKSYFERRRIIMSLQVIHINQVIDVYHL